MIKNVRPTYEVTIGAAYFCMIESRTNTAITYEVDEESSETKVWELDVIKTLGLTQNVAELNVYASGILFDTLNRTSSADIALGVVALPEKLLEDIQGVTSNEGFTFNRTNDINREFAFGYWGENNDGSKTMIWHPVCKLVPTEETHETSTDEIAEPERSYTVRVIPYNNLWRTRYSTARALEEGGALPIPVDVFFKDPIYSEEQIPDAPEPPIGD